MEGKNVTNLDDLYIPWNINIKSLILVYDTQHLNQEEELWITWQKTFQEIQNWWYISGSATEPYSVVSCAPGEIYYWLSTEGEKF